MADLNATRCPKCDSPELLSVASAAIDTDSELLECQGCKSAYEVKYDATGMVRLVAV
jgi:hypothetical protein